MSIACCALSTPSQFWFLVTSAALSVSADVPYAYVVNSWPTFSSSVIRAMVFSTHPRGTCALADTAVGMDSSRPHTAAVTVICLRKRRSRRIA